MASFSHHAYLYEGPLSDFDRIAAAARELLGGTNGSMADRFERTYGKFGIDDARELIELASLRGAGDRSLFIIGVAHITTEAQQALLKLFEEPRAGLAFVVLMPHGAILPTLRSRMMPLPAPTSSGEPAADSAARTFLASSAKERSGMLAAVLKADDARERLRWLLNHAERLIYYEEPAEDARAAALAEIAAMRPYLSDRSASLKMIGEHLAAVLPRF